MSLGVDFFFKKTLLVPLVNIIPVCIVFWVGSAHWLQACIWQNDGGGVRGPEIWSSLPKKYISNFFQKNYVFRGFAGKTNENDPHKPKNEHKLKHKRMNDNVTNKNLDSG